MRLCGRKKAKEWDEVTVMDNRGKSTCNHCGQEVSCKIERIRTHLQKCPNRNNYKDRTVMDEYSNEDSASWSGNKRTFVFQRDTSAMSNCNSHYSPNAAYKKQKIINTSTGDKNDLDLQLARFFYACDIPTDVIENEEFVKFIQLLNPGYELPTKREVNSELFDIIQEQMTDKLRNDSIESPSSSCSNSRKDRDIEEEAAECFQNGLKDAISSSSDQVKDLLRGPTNLSAITEIWIELLTTKYLEQSKAVIANDKDRNADMNAMEPASS